MKRSYLWLFIVAVIACKPSYNLASLTEDKCGQYSYGMIEFKRLISEEEKKTLQTQGLFIQDYLFDQVYQGVWHRKWDKMKLSATPIKRLKEYTPSEKISDGIILDSLDKDKRSCMLLIQSISPLDVNELKKYGKLLHNNDQYYRLESQYRNIPSIIQNRCIKHISVMTGPADIPELKD